jgi:thiol-disulfide isomerase/thioredoxin
MRWACSLVIAMGCVPELYSDGGTGGDWVPPATNSWELATPPDDLVAQGYQEGQVPPDLRLVDQHGDEVSLWQFYGDVVLLDISTMWCAPCQELALHTQETQEDYEAEGFTYVTVLQQDVEGGDVELPEVLEWTEAFDIEAPTLADPDRLTEPAISQGQYPAVLVIGRDMTIATRVKTVTDGEVRKAIEGAL